MQALRYEHLGDEFSTMAMEYNRSGLNDAGGSVFDKQG
jgi:hypothetical protein